MVGENSSHNFKNKLKIIPIEQCIQLGLLRKIGGLVDETLHTQRNSKMHKTSTTHISETLTKLRKIDSKLEQSSFTPIEELLGFLIAGSIILNELSDTTVKSQFTDEEEAFVELLITRINTEFEEIYANNGADEWDSYNGNNDNDNIDNIIDDWDN